MGYTQIDPVDRFWILQHIKKYVIAGCSEKQIVDATIGYVYENSGIHITRESIRHHIHDIRYELRMKKCRLKRDTPKNQSAQTFQN